MSDDAGGQSDDADAGGAAGTDAPESTEEPDLEGKNGNENGNENGNGNGNGNGDGAPHVDLSMYQLSVSVRGSADDELDDVGEAARDLMDYLAEKSVELEERPDNRGLS